MKLARVFYNRSDNTSQPPGQLEMILNFFVATNDRDGNYVDSLHIIARLYTLRPSGFWFDLSTSVPLGYMDLAIAQECNNNAGLSDDTRLLRLLKPVRVFKLLRVLRIFKFADQISDFIMRYCGTLSFSIIRTLLGTSFVIHFFACFFWRFKLETTSTEERGYSFIFAVNKKFGIEGSGRQNALLRSLRVQPDDDAGKYVLSFYFIMTVFTSVGFGDITFTDMKGRVFCIFLFISGSLLFGFLVSQINNILENMLKKKQGMDSMMNMVLEFIRKFRLSSRMVGLLRRWVRFRHSELDEIAQMRRVLDDAHLPEVFRVTLAQYVLQYYFAKIPFLSRANNLLRARFVAEIVLQSELQIFSTGSVVADSQTPADRIMVLHTGLLDLFVIEGVLVSESTSEGQHAAGVLAPIAESRNRCKSVRRNKVFVLKPGDFIGDCAAVGDKRWTGSYGINADVIARGDVGVISINLRHFWRIVNQLEFRLIKRRIERGTAYWRHICRKAESQPSSDPNEPSSLGSVGLAADTDQKPICCPSYQGQKALMFIRFSRALLLREDCKIRHSFHIF